MRFLRDTAAGTANLADRQAMQELTADQTEEVGGGMWPIIIIAVACALLLKHD